MAIDMLLGYILLLVGFVFFCNGMTILGAKEVGVYCTPFVKPD